MTKFYFLVVYLLFSGVNHSRSGVSYQKQVQPILQRTCQGCHNPKDPAGDLSLTSYTSFEKGGTTGPLFVSGSPDHSIIFDFIVGDPPEMPINADPLTEDEVSLIRQWILEGAIDDTIVKSIQALTEVPNYQKPPVISALAFSPDGQKLAISGYGEVLVHQADGTGLIARLIGKSDRIESIAYTPDGKILVVSVSLLFQGNYRCGIPIHIN